MLQIVSSLADQHAELMASELAPERVLTRALLRELKDRAIDASEHQETFEKAIKEAFIAGRDHLTIETGDARIDAIATAIELTDDLLNRELERTADMLVLDEQLTERLTTIHLNSVLENRAAELTGLKSQQSEFEHNLALTWERPLRTFDIQLAVAYDAGEAWSASLRADPQFAGPLVEVLSRLHARGVQVAHEVRVLLRAGFADGAMGRWRTMHELAVVSLFIFQEGVGLAQRYLDHIDIEQYRAALQYQTAAPALGYEPLPDSVVVALTARRQQHIDQHGRAFADEWGWAAPALGNKRPTFSAVEEAVKLEKFRPYFKMASNTVHAGPNGINITLGLLNHDVLLAGPSNAGLQEAARLSALSLTQLSAPLLTLRPNLDGIVWAGVLHRLAARIELEAIEVMKQVEKKSRTRS